MKTIKHFYSPLIDFDELVEDIENLDLSQKEKAELAELAHLNLHSTILDAVLSELTETDKKNFLELLARGQHDQIWKTLNTKVEGIEDKITNAGKQVKKELREDIKKVRKI